MLKFQEFKEKEEAIFINLDERAHNEMLRNENDIYRRNSVRQNLKSTDFVKSLKQSGFNFMEVTDAIRINPKNDDPNAIFTNDGTMDFF